MGNTANKLSQTPVKGSIGNGTGDHRKWFAKRKHRHIRVRSLTECDPCRIGERPGRMAVVVFQIRPGMCSRLVTELPDWCSIGDFEAEDMPSLGRSRPVKSIMLLRSSSAPTMISW